MSVKILSGKWKGQSLKVPKKDVRPTSSRLKEALFNRLQAEVEGSAWLELFAGSAAISLEALSRGAARATVVESGGQASLCIKNNAKELGASALKLLKLDAQVAVKQLLKKEERFDIVFMDPPYESYVNKEPLSAVLLLMLEPLLNEGAQVFIEESKRLTLADHYGPFVKFDERRYGDSLLHSYRLSS